MKGFTLFKGNECPICVGAKKDCRQSNESGMVFCRESSTNPTGFIFRGSDKWGFGLWQATEAAEAFASQSKEEWQRQQQQRQIEQQRRQQQQIANQLSAADRHKFYSQILDQLPLRQIDRTDLEFRGFSPLQIEADGYRSVQQWQEILGSFPSNLPGLLTNGKLNSNCGYVFPIKNVDGLIVAFSIRLTDATNGRYRWLTSATKKNPDGATPHLDGELPLAVFEPSEYRGDAIWLPEGVGIKPSLVRYRLGVPVLGASSGRFDISPKTCKASLEKLSAKYGTKKLVIPVDAGDAKNPQVFERWQREFQFLQGLGYDLQVAWWGQIDKSQPDIDELEDLSVIQFINCEEFKLWAGREEIAKSVSKNIPTRILPQPISIQNQQTSRDKSQKPGQLPSNKINQESLLLPQSATLDILNPPLIASFPIQSLRDGIFKVLPIPKSVASCLITENKAPRQQRRWFEIVLKRIKKVFSKKVIKNQPRLGFKCFKEDNPEFEDKIRKIQRKLRSLSYQPDILLNQRYLPDDLPTQLPKSGLIGLVAPKGSGKSYLLKKIIQLAKKEGITILSITPRIALGREQAIKWEITWIDDYGVMQTRAEDTTKQIAEVAQKRSEARDKLAELEKISHYQLSLLGESEKEKIEKQKFDLKVEIERYGEQIENINTSSIKTLALCWDSLWRTKDRDLKESLILIDEAELGFKHFISGSTCKHNRPYLLKVFKDKLIESLMSGGRVILSDADLTDLPVNYVREILPIPIKPFIIKNEYIGDETRWVADFRTGSRGSTLNDIVEGIRNGAYLAITTDSRAEAEALEKLILKELPDDFCAFLDKNGNITDEAQARQKALIVRIDRTTTETDAGKEFIEKPNQQILHWQPRILIYTPSMGVGVSIDETTQRWDEEWEDNIPYFDAVYGLFFGVIEPSQCRQQLARIRANVPRIIWCKESNKALEGCSSFFPEEVKRQTLKYNHSALNILDISKAIAGFEANDEEIREVMLQLLIDAWDKDSRCWKEPSIDLDAAFKARENYGLWNLANLLREELEDEGHTVVSLGGGKSYLTEEISVIKDEFKMEEATLISKASTIPVEDARKILNKLGATKDEHRSAQKTLLEDELPEVNLTPEFIKKAVVDDRRRWLNRHRLFWYYSNSEIVKQIDTDHWLSNLRKFAEGTPFMRDIRSNAPKVDALRKSGIFEFVNLEDCDRIYQGDTPEAEAFLKQCLKYKDDLQVALNVLVTRKTTPISLANRILSKVGLKLKKLTRSNKDTRWQLSADLVNDSDRLSVLKAFELRWQISQEEAEQKKAEKQAQSQSQQDTQLGGQSPNYIDTKTDRPPNFEEGSQGVSDQSQCETGGVSLEVQELLLSQSQRATQVGGQSLSYIDVKPDCPPNLEEVSQGVSDLAGELVEAFKFCEELHQFAAVAEGYSDEAIGNAIALVDTAPKRRQLEEWYQQLKVTEVSDRRDEAIPYEEEKDSPAEASRRQIGYDWKELPSVGQMLHWVSGGLEKLVLKAIDADGSCQVKSLLSGMFTNTYVAQLKPA